MLIYGIHFNAEISVIYIYMIVDIDFFSINIPRLIDF